LNSCPRLFWSLASINSFLHLLLVEVHADGISGIHHTTHIPVILEDVDAVVDGQELLAVVIVPTLDSRNLEGIDNVRDQDLLAELGILALGDHVLQQAGNLDTHGRGGADQAVNDVAPVLVGAARFGVNHISRPIAQNLAGALPELGNLVGMFHFVVQEAVVRAEAVMFVHSHSVIPPRVII